MRCVGVAPYLTESELFVTSEKRIHSAFSVNIKISKVFIRPAAFATE